MRLKGADLKKFAKLCSKKERFVNKNLAGVIKHEHHISPKKFHKALEPHLDAFRHSYRHWYNLDLPNIETTAAWVNFMAAGEFNPPHIHTGCDFSSVLFIKVPTKLKEENKKYIGRGEGPGALTFTYGESQQHSMSQKSFFPEEGDLYIFPATLTHFVAPFMCKEERISMSANFKLEK